MHTSRLNTTANERIANISGWTGADGNMIHYIALRVLAAYSGTRILAFVLQAGLVAGTFRIEDALGTTGFIRITDILGQASTFTIIAYGICTTWG